MNPNGISRSAVLVSIVFTISVFCLGLFVWVSFGGNVPLGAKGYEVRVRFGAEASNLFPNAQARISGVPVGRVTKVETSGSSVVATIELDEDYVPLHRGASAVLRSKTLLGEAFIELAPGPQSLPPIEDGGSLDTARVTTAQGVDNALSIFDERGRRDLRVFLEGLAKATDGRGPDVNAALGNAPMTMESLRELVTVLNKQRPALQGLVRDMGTTLRTVSKQRGAVQQIARAGAEVLQTTSSRDEQLTATVRELPALMRTLRTFSADTTELSRAAAPAVSRLAPVADRLEPGLRAGRALAPDLQQALRALDQTNRASEAGVPALSDIVRQVGPLLEVLDPAGRELVPVVRTLEQFRTDAVTSLANTGAATNATYTRSGGGLKNYLRVILQLNNEIGYGQTDRGGDHRENAYAEPGSLQRLIEDKPLTAVKCDEASKAPNPPLLGSGAPPCVQAEPYSLGGGPPGLIPQVVRDESKP